VGQAKVAENAELAAKSQVDAGRLEISLLPGIDNEPAGLDFLFDAPVAENRDRGASEAILAQ
jgi:hypothetical protein